jgi:hypothetical protein
LLASRGRRARTWDGYKRQFGVVNVGVHELDTATGHFTDDCFTV